MDLPPIRLEEDREMLGEAVIQAVMPKVPGLIKGQNGLEVIGKGAPQIYINGRRRQLADRRQRYPRPHEIKDRLDYGKEDAQ